MRRGGDPGVGLGARLRLAVVALTLLAAPTVGDIGSCGQEVLELDPVKFFAEKAFVDCRQCSDCGIATDRCRRACEGELEATTFPQDCFPLVHDGEVCLRALRAASCGDYEIYVDDVAPGVPTECNFCPLAEAPGEPDQGQGGGAGSGGAGGGAGGGS